MNGRDMDALAVGLKENIERITADKGMSFLIPVSMVEEELNQDADRYAVDDSTFPVINADWIISLFQEPEGTFAS